MPMYVENILENYYKWGKFNLTYQNVNKLAIYKNCDLDNFPLALRNSEGVTNIKEEALCGKKSSVYFQD